MYVKAKGCAFIYLVKSLVSRYDRLSSNASATTPKLPIVTAKPAADLGMRVCVCVFARARVCAHKSGVALIHTYLPTPTPTPHTPHLYLHLHLRTCAREAKGDSWRGSSRREVPPRLYR